MITGSQLEILQHALGVNEFGQPSRGLEFTHTREHLHAGMYSRNHFCAGAGDESDCRALVEAGYAANFERSFLPYYNITVTPEGMNAMRDASPIPPKLTRSQMRYRRFLDADSGMTFREWLKYCDVKECA